MASLDGVTEIYVGSEPTGLTPDAGYIFVWMEGTHPNIVKKYKDSSGNVGNVGTSGISELNDLSDATTTGGETGDFLIRNASGNYVTGKTTASVFGCGADEISRNELDSNSSATFEEYLRLEAVACELNKKYRIGVFVIWAMSSNSNDYEADLYVQENGQTAQKIGELRQEAQDPGQDQKISSAGFFYYTPTASTDFDVWIEYRPEGGNGTAYTWYAGIEAWRTGL